MDDNRDTCSEETIQSHSRKSITDKTHWSSDALNSGVY